jgi:hypothetical protein
MFEAQGRRALHRLRFQFPTAINYVKDKSSSLTYAAARKEEFRTKYDSGRVYVVDQVYKRMEAFFFSAT